MYEEAIENGRQPEKRREEDWCISEEKGTNSKYTDSAPI